MKCFKKHELFTLIRIEVNLQSVAHNSQLGSALLARQCKLQLKSRGYLWQRFRARIINRYPLHAWTLMARETRLAKVVCLRANEKQNGVIHLSQECVFYK